jgi:hypothetical protein
LRAPSGGAGGGGTPRREPPHRAAANRRLASPPRGLRFDSDPRGRLKASIYSLPSSFFDAATAARFLSAVRALDPRREILVLADPPMAGALAPQAKTARLRLLVTSGRRYSPWPRDPFSLVHTPKGRLVALARPNLQPGREDDSHLAEELVRLLPADLDRRWGGKSGVAWAIAATPFHNGQVLLTGDAAWVTIHALEPRILALLGLARVPVETFGTAEGIARYLDAAHRAAAELGELYGRPVRFVHPLPETGPLEERVALLRRLGGAAGYDLDSILTFVPAPAGGLAALVADAGLGRLVLDAAPDADLDALRAGFDLAPRGAALRAALAAAQREPATRALGDFLDLAAAHLAQQGFAVRRLPLLSVPVALLRDYAGLTHRELLLTWNNVVVEERDGKPRAEGFSYLFPTGDAAARHAFAVLGVHLDLLPPLVHSIVLNGGYRCASNHLRAR